MKGRCLGNRTVFVRDEERLKMYEIASQSWWSIFYHYLVIGFSHVYDDCKQRWFFCGQSRNSPPFRAYTSGFIGLISLSTLFNDKVIWHYGIRVNSEPKKLFPPEI